MSFGWVEAELGEVAEGALERARVCFGVFVPMQLDVRDAAVVVDDAVGVVVADTAAAVVLDPGAGDAMARDTERPSFFTSRCKRAPGRDHS
jgi:hypothetical protein